MDNFCRGLKSLALDIPMELVQQELVFLDELMRWNQHINLTSIRRRDEAIEKHLLDSLALLPYLSAGSLLDMGSGGGLPGIPLAIAMPELRVTSVDSVGKKINFQKHIKRQLQLQNLTPIQARLENLSQYVGAACRFDYVVARAFSSFEAIFSLAAPWLAADGRLLVMKGPEGLAELKSMAAEFTPLGYLFEGCYPYQLPFSGSERHLIVLKKQSD